MYNKGFEEFGASAWGLKVLLTAHIGEILDCYEHPSSGCLREGETSVKIPGGWNSAEL